MSDEEKLAQFYSVVVDIIVDKKRKCKGVKADEQGHGARSQDHGEANENGTQLGNDGAGVQHGNREPGEHGTQSAGDTTNGRSGEELIATESEAGSQSGRNGIEVVPSRALPAAITPPASTLTQAPNTETLP